MGDVFSSDLEPANQGRCVIRTDAFDALFDLDERAAHVIDLGAAWDYESFGDCLVHEFESVVSLEHVAIVQEALE
jgi:hypothetical protein